MRRGFAAWIDFLKNGWMMIVKVKTLTCPPGPDTKHKEQKQVLRLRSGWQRRKWQAFDIIQRSA
jgi:hypothetical protein